MAFDNTITIVGNLTRDPELRYTQSGKALTKLGLAWSRKDKQGEETVGFFDVTCWGDLAENVAESVSKGTRVVVYGRVDYQSWEDKEGQKRSKVEVVADEVSPSLRWATAQVDKTPPGGSNGNGNRAVVSSAVGEGEPF